MNKCVALEDFRCGDDVATFASAVDYLRKNPGTTLVVPRGQYEITSPLARQQMEDVLQGRFGGNPQSVMFNPEYEYTKGIDLSGVQDCKIEGSGAVLMVDGFMEPISVTHGKNVELSGFTIDHKRKPYTKGIITYAGDITEAGHKECEIELEDNIFPGTPFSLRIMVYDPESQRDFTWAVEMVSYEYVDNRHVKVVLTNGQYIKPGMEFYSVHTYHSRPAILIENSENIRLTDVTIHSQPGMGVVGNRSKDITLTRLSVVPSCGHHMATNTDGTHFTSITGKLRIENCFFENTGDDFTNIHGYFHDIVYVESPTVCYMQEKTPDGTHAQTLDYPDVGDVLELTVRDTLEIKDTYKVVKCEPMPEQWMCKVTLDHPLPESTDGYLLADITRLPEVEIIGCSASSHYARSILLKCRKALVEGNTFRHVQGPAIVAAAETWWYEGVCPSNIIIRKNRVISCAERWGEAAGVVVKADCNNPSGQTISNILIEDNIIDSPNADHGMFIRNAKGVTIRGNSINCKKEPVVFNECLDVEIEQ